MEDLWQKFKEETTEDLSKIKNFLNEMSHDEKSLEKKIAKRIVPKAASSVKSKTPRKKIYGKLKDLVQEIMKKENLSRAQAYRVARKRLDNF
jgi:putative heme degradation protein